MICAVTNDDKISARWKPPPSDTANSPHDDPPDELCQADWTEGMVCVNSLIDWDKMSPADRQLSGSTCGSRTANSTCQATSALLEKFHLLRPKPAGAGVSGLSHCGGDGSLIVHGGATISPCRGIFQLDGKTLYQPGLSGPDAAGMATSLLSKPRAAKW